MAESGAVLAAAATGFVGAYVLYRIWSGKPPMVDKWEQRARRAFIQSYWRNRVNARAVPNSPYPQNNEFDVKDYPLLGLPYMTENGTLIVPDKTSGIRQAKTPRGEQDIKDYDAFLVREKIKARPNVQYILDNF